MRVFEKVVTVAALTGAATLGVGLIEGGSASAHTIDIVQIAPKCPDGLGGNPEIEVDFQDFGDQIGNKVTTDATNGYHESHTITAENVSTPLYIQAAVGKITVKTVWPGNKEEKDFDIVACVPPATEASTTTAASTTTTTKPATTTTVMETTVPATTPAETTIVTAAPSTP